VTVGKHAPMNARLMLELYRDLAIDWSLEPCQSGAVLSPSFPYHAPTGSRVDRLSSCRETPMALICWEFRRPRQISNEKR